MLDAGLACHLGVVLDGAPVVLPTVYGRMDDTLYLHGSTGARILRAAVEAPVCVTVTHVDGVVVARSVFHHSMNYRSAVVHGHARLVTDDAERRVARCAPSPSTWRLVPGTTPGNPTRKELAATAVLALDLAEASVKVRTGPPVDDDEDVAGRRPVGRRGPVRTESRQPEPCPCSLQTPQRRTTSPPDPRVDTNAQRCRSWRSRSGQG